MSPDAKNVKDITRKVIRTLEGLGHLDSIDVIEQDRQVDNNINVNLAGAISPATAENVSHDIDSPNGLPARRDDPSMQNGRPALDLPKNIDWEIPRKVLHASIGFFTLHLYTSDGHVKFVIFALWTALAIIVPADVLRLRYPPFERLFERVLGILMRESEKESTNGVIWYILGVNFALTFYPPDIATVAILILSWADTAASTFGRLWGPKTPRLPPRAPVFRLPLAPRKSVAGFVAATVTGTIIAIGFWGWIAPLRHSTADLTWTWNDGAPASSALAHIGLPCHVFSTTGGWIGLGTIGIFSGLVSGIAEALDLGSLDDNLTLPIISGGCIWCTFIPH